MNTYVIKGEYTDHKWYVFDAENQTLGRFCSKIAAILRGKHKPVFSPNRDVGDFVVIVNADKINVTGRKMENKIYYKHTGYVGHLRTKTMKKMMLDKPEFAVHEAIRKMLPKNALGRKTVKKLKVYAGAEHPHSAQTPEVLDLSTFR